MLLSYAERVPMDYRGKLDTLDFVAFLREHEQLFI